MASLESDELSGRCRIRFRYRGQPYKRSLKTEGTHVSNLLRHLRKSKPVQSLTTADVQAYVEKRGRDTYRGKAIRPDTVKKEVATLRLIWNWAVTQGYVTGPAPTKGIKYPKTEQKLPFMTWNEIETIIARGGLDEEQERQLWGCLFLTASEFQQVLDHVKKAAHRAFIFPMFVFVAHTGARRSEILRSQVDDFDFQSHTVLIREKKRTHEKSLTYRRVRMSVQLAETMQEWFAEHPGGQHTICKPVRILRGKTRTVGVPLTRSESHDHLKRTLSGSKWAKIRGFHVFRHSFASNLAAGGVMSLPRRGSPTIFRLKSQPQR